MLTRWIRPWFKQFIRNVDAPALFESFFIAAVASFLGIRWFLELTGYPQIGSSGLHIAHVLFGGLLMLFAMLLQIGFMDRPTQQASAVIGGLGFGTFIDEIGKFVTADNDYFYRPAVALIYAAFVIAFLVTRTFVGRRRLGQREALANAMRLLAAESDGVIEPEDRARIVRLLDRAGKDSERTKLARRYLGELGAEREELNFIEAARERVGAAYEALMATSWADRALTIAVIAYALAALVGVGLVGFLTSQADPTSGGFATVTRIASTIAGAALIARGVLSLPTSRIDAFRWFQRGILVWILITQVFVFYSSQFAGLIGLAADLVAYGSLRYAIEREIGAGRDLKGSTG